MIDEIIVDDNLKNLGAYFENFDERDKRKVEEAIVLYLHNFSKTLIELEKDHSKNLYNLIDARRMTTSKIDREMKERELVNVYTCITHDEVKRLIEEAKKKEFRSKNRIKKLMIENVEEVRKETKDIWKKIIQDDSLYKDAFKSFYLEEKQSVFRSQKVETQFEDHLED